MSLTAQEHDTATSTAKKHLAPPQNYSVCLLNDDYTPMDFVVAVLSGIFYLPTETAVAIMLKIHHEGKGVCGVFSHDIALTKQQQVLDCAERAGHPLQCTVEPAP